MIKETTELNSRSRPEATPEDDRFSGVAKHPLARRWLKRCRVAEMRAAVATRNPEARAKHHRRAAGLSEQLKPEGSR